MARERLFRGWVVVAGAFLVMFVGFGISYSFSAFFNSLQKEFNATRGEISLIFAISSFLYFCLGAISGPLADKIGPRGIVVTGMGLITAGLLLASQASALWQVYALYSVGVGFGVGAAYVPSIGAVQRWFVRKRGFASGLATAGIGAGTLVMPAVSAGLIDQVGWRGAYLFLAACTTAVGIASIFMIEHSPQKRNLLPDGDLPPIASPNSAKKPGTTPTLAVGAGSTLLESLKQRPFWLLYFSSVFASFGLFIPFVHLVPYTRDHGMGETTGVFLIGLIGVGSTAGRFILGGLADKLGRRRTLAYLISGLGIMLLWWLISVDLWSLAIFAFLFGVFYGGFVALIPAITADYFGGRSVSGIIGFLYTSVALGALLGPTLAGLAFDLSHSYLVPILVSVVTSAIGVAFILVLPDPKTWQVTHSAS